MSLAAVGSFHVEGAGIFENGESGVAETVVVVDMAGTLDCSVPTPFVANIGPETACNAGSDTPSLEKSVVATNAATLFLAGDDVDGVVKQSAAVEGSPEVASFAAPAARNETDGAETNVASMASLSAQTETSGDTPGNAKQTAEKWSISGMDHLAEPQVVNQNSIRLLETLRQFPANLDFRVRFNANPLLTSATDPLGSSRWKNALIIFDYRGPEDYKFAGAFVGTDVWAIGRMTSRGYVLDTSVSEEINEDTDHEMTVRMEGTKATLIVEGETKLRHTFDEPLNEKMLGLATYGNICRFVDLLIEEG